MNRSSRFAVILSLLAMGRVMVLPAQAHDHAAHMQQSGTPTEAGQAAFAVIKEVVALLEADPTTDWSKVDLEALRRHLIAMDLVMMESQVVSRPVSGGIELSVTGSGETASAIRETLTNHAGVLDRDPTLRAEASPIPDGIRLTVAAEDPSDARQVARIRGLGFAGLLATGDHHAVHHMAIARGLGAEAHRHD